MINCNKHKYLFVKALIMYNVTVHENNVFTNKMKCVEQSHAHLL